MPTVSAAILPRSTSMQVPGAIIGGRYRLERVLGEGGMGAVFAATQLTVNRQVALKVLRAEMSTNPRMLRRFYQEARAASQLSHPHIVRVFEFGVDADTAQPFMSMELVEGRSLGTVLKQDGPLSERRAARLIGQVAKALGEAHQKGVVHRDLKPENVMVSVLPEGDEHARVLDFGIAKVMHDGDSVPRLTITGAAVGTPLYMSPEQVAGHQVDFRADLYALGCMFHELLAGTPPISGELVQKIMLNQMWQAPAPLPAVLSDGLAPSSGAIALRNALLEKEREARPSSTVVVIKALGMLERGEAGEVARLFAGERASAVAPAPASITREDEAIGFADTVEAQPREVPVAELAAPAARRTHPEAVPSLASASHEAIAPRSSAGPLMIALGAIGVAAALAIAFLIGERDPLPAPVVAAPAPSAPREERPRPPATTATTTENAVEAMTPPSKPARKSTRPKVPPLAPR